MRPVDHDQSGQARTLTILAPIQPGQENHLADELADLPLGDGSPLARVPGTHFARWVVIDEPVYSGRPQRRDTWRTARLLFTSNFDGPLNDYLESLRLGLGADADALFRHCIGYPGSADAQAWTAWMYAHKVATAMFFAAYGEQTVDEVKRNVELRGRLIAFALEAQELEPMQLQARFLEVFTR
jgi:hypothetical protein